MRLPALFLALSLAANAVFAWRVWSLHYHHVDAPLAAPAPVVPAGPPPPPPRPLGEQLHTDDPATLTARLREMGLPPSLLNALVADRLKQTLNHKLRDLNNENGEGGYWIGSPNFGPDQMRAMITLQTNFEAQLRELLGDDYNSDPIRVAELQRQYGPIDPAKLPQLKAILSDYQSLRASYTVTMFRLPGDAEEQALLAQEEQADLAALLSPTELLEYNLRNGRATSQLRNNLAVMQVTEDEFRQLLPLWQQMPTGREAPRVIDYRDTGTPEEKAAREAFVAEATTFLGAERAADLVQAINPQAMMENMFASRLGLPASSAKTLYETRIAAMDFLRNDAPSSDSDAADADAADATARAGQAQAMLDQLQGTINPENLQIYQNTFGGWITQLEKLAKDPPAAAPAPPAPGNG